MLKSSVPPNRATSPVAGSYAIWANPRAPGPKVGVRFTHPPSPSHDHVSLKQKRKPRNPETQPPNRTEPFSSGWGSKAMDAPPRAAGPGPK